MPDAKVNAADAYPSDTRYKILRSLSLSFSAALAFISTHDHFKGPRRKRVSETEVIAFTPHTPSPLSSLLPPPLEVLAKWGELRLRLRLRRI